MNDLSDAFAHAILPASIHPAIDHALASFDAPRAGIAARAICAALAARLAGGGDPWGGSRLTGDGFPLEIAFSTADDRIRATVEPGARTLPAAARLEVVATILEGLGEPVPRPVLDGLLAMQAAGPLAYGAWLGLRAGAQGVAGQAYVEVPRGAPLRARSLPLGSREVTPRMIAYTPSSASFEAYVRVRALEPGELPAVLAPIGGEARVPSLLEFIEEAHGYRIRERFPGPVGVSYGWPSSERVTLHFYARAMWGPDAAIRRGFCRVARGLGWDDATYLRATAPIAERNDWKTFHGLLAVTLDAGGAVSLGIGVRPVAP